MREMDLGLKDRVAIVGGSTRGMGRAIALAFAHEGANVTICGRTETDLRRTEIDLARTSSQQHVLAIPADISDARDIRRVVRDTISRFGHVDILVTHMGYHSAERPSELSDDEILNSLSGGFLGAVRLSREVVPYMKRQHWGRILNLLPELNASPQTSEYVDVSGETGLAHSNWMALVGYAKSLANELAPFNITVNNLIHGPVLSEALNAALEERSEAEERPKEELLREMAAPVPMGRLGRLEEVGDTAVYLCSERSSFMTGESVVLDGGMRQEIH